MKKYKYLIVLFLIVTIGLLCFHPWTKYSNSHVVQNSSVNNGNSDISLGDECTTTTNYWCGTGTKVGYYCYSDPKIWNTSGSCASNSGYWANNTCYGTRTAANYGTSTTCTSCDAGKYLSGSLCVACPDGKVCPGGTKEPQSCGECEYPDSSTNTCKKCDIEITPDENIVSPGNVWHIKVLAKTGGDYCPNVNSNDLKVTAPNNPCGYSWGTINYCNKSKTTKIKVAGSWQSVGDGLFDRDMVKTRKDADGKDLAYYSIIDGTTHTIWEFDTVEMEHGSCTPSETDPGKYACTGVEQRGMCGSTRSQTYKYCCVNNQYVGVSSSAKWTGDENNGVGVPLNYNEKKDGKYGCAYYYGDDYTYVDVPKDKCKVTEDVPGRCSASTVVGSPVNEETSKCEEYKQIKIFDGEKCTGADLGAAGTDIKTSFYTISCERNLGTNFDYGDDNNANTTRELYKGQGFKFGITATTKIQCDGEFFGSRWTDVYKKLWKKVENIESGLVNACKDFSEAGLTRCENYINGMHFNRGDTKKDVFTLLTIIRELVEIVDTYNNYAPNMEYNEGAKINFNYTINGKQSTKVVDEVFNKNVVSEGIYKTTSESTVNLGVAGITNPKNYTRNNYAQPRVVKFAFKNVYLDKTTGAVTTSTKDRIDGGPRIYIDYNADVQTISINSPGIVVTGLAGNNSSVTDNKCTIKIKDKDIIYRPIDVSNPFINNKWTPGENWINSQFDFRGVIHSDIWSSSCYSKYSNGAWRKCS